MNERCRHLQLQLDAVERKRGDHTAAVPPDLIWLQRQGYTHVLFLGDEAELCLEARDLVLALAADEDVCLDAWVQK